MKSIFRSPIEPEFSELVANTLREKRRVLIEGVRGAFEHEKKRGIRIKTHVLALAGAWSRKVEHVVFRAKHFVKVQMEALQKRIRASLPPRETTEAPDPVVVPDHTPLVTTDEQIPELPYEKRANVQRFLDFVRRVPGIGTFSGRSYALMLLLLVGIVTGGAFKSLARDTVTIGFEDYKAGTTEHLLDLNEIQAHLMENGGTTALASPVEGEQCIE